MPLASDAPQPAAGTPADRAQIAQSNQTLNTFLGRHRPAWMTDAPPSAHPLATASGHETTQSLAPQPSPRRPRGRPRKHALPEAPKRPLQSAPASARNSSVLPSPVLTNEPSPAASGYAASPYESNAAFTAQPTCPSSDPPQTLPALETPLAQDPSHTQGNLIVNSPAPASINVSTPDTVSNRPGSRPSSRDSRRIASTGESGQAGTSSAAGASERPSKRPRVDTPAGHASGISKLEDQLMNGWLEILDQRIRTHSHTIRGAVLKPRYQMLRDACVSRDAFYVLLHQQFCLWSLDRAVVHATFSSLRPATIDSAFEQLLFVLRRNDEMAQDGDHLQWLSQFPGPFGFITNLFAPHTNYHAQIGLFLGHFSLQWSQLVANIEARRFPLMACEPIQVLQCPSSVLLPVFFTLSRRRLGVDDGPLSAKLNGLLAQDQMYEANMARDRLPSNRVAHMRGAMASQYKMLIPAPRQTTQQAVPTPPPALSPGVAQHPQWNGHAPPVQAVNSTYVIPSNADPMHNAMRHGPPSHFNQPSPLPLNIGQPAPNTNVPMRPMSQHAPTQDWPANQNQQSQTGFFPPRLSQVQNGQVWTQSPNGTVQSPMANSFPMAAAFSPANSSPMSTHAQPYSPHPQLRTRAPGDHMLPHPGNAPSAQQPAQYWSGGVPHPRRESGSAPRAIQAQASPRPSPQQQRRPAFPITRIPEHEYPTNAYDTTSLRPSLHLVQVRSPRRAAAVPTNTRYYQYMVAFPVQPISFPPLMGLRSLTFSISEQDLSRIARTTSSNGLPVCHYSDGSSRYRLRLCARSHTEGEMTESEWAVMPSHWPEHIHATLNEQPLLLRRKQHFHHDLPVELTDALMLGENKVKVSLPEVATNKKAGKAYYMAVELITTLSHDAVVYLVESADRIGTDDTKNEVQRRLRPMDVDDVVVENDALCVSVADPFSFSLFTVPVRGIHCKHLDCFDLETWLETRPKKSKAAGEPCLPDSWKCPICGLDARPSSLRIDDFFSQVRKQLVEDGLEHTKKINIKPDGSWTAVEEEEDSEDEGSVSKSASKPASKVLSIGGGSRRASVMPETIEILDD